MNSDEMAMIKIKMIENSAIRADDWSVDSVRKFTSNIWKKKEGKKIVKSEQILWD
jgi:hypothetical protein